MPPSHLQNSRCRTITSLASLEQCTSYVMSLKDCVVRGERKLKAEKVVMASTG